MAEGNATVPTGASVDDFLSGVEPAGRREDGLALKALFSEETGEFPLMWGSSIVGYGRYRYRYETGREGDWFWCGFSPRKAKMSLYFMPGYGAYEKEIAALGPVKTGASCVYVGRLAKVDEAALRRLVRTCTQRMRAEA
ncbi:DUF1801 domain-containing protein [Parvularcula dongshanensis]|uniref:YdhG-like domain-containing protein n=1 Tax=Parvularcula dongshanensis TaxID=1173995 RepID=A0A840I2G0_9PROT|nr:DUF1801 domain-containing protein [Parvularcula dongshanensis]MBB4658471.1 hypothetical protein [Parvularcula dongshanensis]